MAALTYLAPEFIKEGRLYWLRTPLYIVKNKNKKEYYYSDEEFNKVRSTIKGEVTRAKGLGELSVEDAKASMFSEEYQRMEPIEWSEEGIELLQDIMGTNVVPRREFIFDKIDFSTIRE